MAGKKKNADTTHNTSKKNQKNTPKKKANEKPKLKKPSIIKSKLPPLKRWQRSKMSPTITEPQSPKKTNAQKRKFGMALRKIELANEVALAQLAKPRVPYVPPPTENLPKDKPRKEKQAGKNPPRKKLAKEKTPAATTVEQESKKRARRKPNEIPDNITDTTEESIAPKPKTPKKSVVAKKECVVVNKANVTSKRKADHTSKKSPKRPTKSKKCPGESTPKRRNRRARGKILDEISSSDHQESPSILKMALRNRTGIEIMENLASRDKTRVVASRMGSLTSCEGIPWTRDISSSSSTTCVTVESPNDFIRFDKKMPIIKLSNIDSQLRKTVANVTDKLVSSDESDSECVEKISQHIFKSSSSDSTLSLDLSTSSVSAAKSRGDKSRADSSASYSTDGCKLKYALDRLASQLRKVDLESITWVGYVGDDTCATVDKFQDNILNVLKEENEVIVHCRSLKSLFSGESVNSTTNNDNETETSPDTRAEEALVESPVNGVNLAIAPEMEKSEEDEFTRVGSRYVMFESCGQNEEPPLPTTPVETVQEDFNSNKSEAREYMSFDQTCDDDDALSLFAESLTGIESLRPNGSTADHEEYVPAPAPYAPPAPRLVYNPTRIVEESNDPFKKPVCEKQNADSTSIFRDTERPAPPVEIAPAEATAKRVPPSADRIVNLPRLLPSIYDPTPLFRSVVFRKVCMFHLLKKCRKRVCLFPHAAVPAPEVRARLTQLSDQDFIAEYLMLRSERELRRGYGSHFILEASNRELTRVLIEMALDFMMTAVANSTEDAALRVEATDAALMHLNTAPLETCVDLLKCNTGTQFLCDSFIEAIAETWNFSRFKLVFIKLTMFIVCNGRTFSPKVATNILERVCILPGELPVARALLMLIRHTDTSIFANSMMSKFEVQVRSLDFELHQEFMAYKERVSISWPNDDVADPNCSPPCQPDGDWNLSAPNSDRKRYTSPDTTKLDNMNKPVQDLVITRVMNLKRLLPYNAQNFALNSAISNDSEDYRPSKKAKFRNWKPQPPNHMGDVAMAPPCNRMRYPPPLMGSVRRPLMRPPMVPRYPGRHGSYGPRYSRRPGPAYYAL